MLLIVITFQALATAHDIYIFWTGTSLQLRLMRGVFSNANGLVLFSMILPTRVSIAN